MLDLYDRRAAKEKALKQKGSSSQTIIFKPADTTRYVAGPCIGETKDFLSHMLCSRKLVISLSQFHYVPEEIVLLMFTFFSFAVMFYDISNILRLLLLPFP